MVTLMEAYDVDNILHCVCSGFNTLWSQGKDFDIMVIDLFALFQEYQAKNKV